MKLPIWQSLTNSEPAIFESALPVQQAAQRLAAVVERSELAKWGVVLTGHFAYPLITKVFLVAAITVLAVISSALLLLSLGAILVGPATGPSRWVGVAGAAVASS